MGSLVRGVVDEELVADLLQHKLVGTSLRLEHALGRRMLFIGSAQQ
jgi:hypothetical protein